LSLAFGGRLRKLEYAEVLVEVSIVNPPRLTEGVYYKEIVYQIVRRKSDGEVFVIVQAMNKEEAERDNDD